MRYSGSITIIDERIKKFIKWFKERKNLEKSIKFYRMKGNILSLDSNSVDPKKVKFWGQKVIPRFPFFKISSLTPELKRD